MLQLRSRDEVASADAGWLRARHHFAIGPYGNPAHKPVGNLIVFNDDEIAPHTGFALHHHLREIERDIHTVDTSQACRRKVRHMDAQRRVA